MSVDWDKVQTNVVSAIIIGALSVSGMIIWRGATTVDDKVTSHTETLQQQSDYMKQAIDLLQQEVRDSKQRDNQIISALNELSKNKIETPEIPEENFIQQKLPRLDMRQAR